MEGKVRVNGKALSVSERDNQSDYDSDEEVFDMTNVKVRVIRSYKAKNPGELSISKGDVLKQLKPANNDKMAYGCLNKFVFCRNYGYYPASCVVLKSRKSWNNL
ncbi:uncharacterized protein LOC135461960 [Liolophura sinensis]|uniref:uncharacterized protein LOC135461960 n=1 Tax=Liolophura sinensis TaxID=3198878 RepID=UPI00315934C3